MQLKQNAKLSFAFLFLPRRRHQTHLEKKHETERHGKEPQKELNELKDHPIVQTSS